MILFINPAEINFFFVKIINILFFLGFYFKIFKVNAFLLML